MDEDEGMTEVGSAGEGSNGVGEDEREVDEEMEVNEGERSWRRRR